MKVSKSGVAFMCIGAFWAWASSSNASASEISPAQTSAQISSAHAVSTSEYVKAHSLGGNYTFDPRDGWQMVNVTNLQYKYRRNSSDKLSNTKRDLGGAVADVFQKLFKGLKGTGKPEQGTITWRVTQHILRSVFNQPQSGTRETIYKILVAGQMGSGLQL